MPKHLQPKPKKFYVDGEVLTLLEVPNSLELPNGWFKTSTKELFDYLPKQFAKDVALRRAAQPKNEIGKINVNPYGGSKGFSISKDHYEIFIPYSSKIK